MITKEDIIHFMPRHYLTCSIVECPLHVHCLRWKTRDYVSEKEHIIMTVNPNHPVNGTEKCEYFRSDEKLTIAWGFVHLIDNMPRSMGTAIRKELETIYGHTIYYEFRRGERPIPPAMRERIASVCLKHGWTEAPVYDRFTEGYDW